MNSPIRDYYIRGYLIISFSIGGYFIVNYSRTIRVYSRRRFSIRDSSIRDYL